MNSRYEALRYEVMDRDGRRCVLCNSEADLSVNNRTYVRYGSEEPGDLTTLCSLCHRTFHEHRKAEGQYRGLLVQAMDLEAEIEALKKANGLAAMEMNAMLATVPGISDRARTLLTYMNSLINRSVAWIEEQGDAHVPEGEMERQFAAWLGMDVPGLYEEAAASAQHWSNRPATPRGNSSPMGDKPDLDLALVEHVAAEAPPLG
jgi:hypothetical protein